LITVRRIQIGEANLLKQIRLESLREAPYAFGVTYDVVLQRSEETWREKADSSAQGSDAATFFVFSEKMPIGMAAIVRLPEQTEVGELLQVWVGSEYRGTSAAWGLLDTIFKWAEENNFQRIIAGVTQGNARALKFYTNYGFSISNELSKDNKGGVYLVKEVK
jgi:RimJ/RimL family protein N-acetyltransferase